MLLRVTPAVSIAMAAGFAAGWLLIKGVGPLNPAPPIRQADFVTGKIMSCLRIDA